MDRDKLQARLEHEIAELRGAFPRVDSCHSALMQWKDGEQARYSLGLDIRGPLTRAWCCGPAQASIEAAVEAAFRLARERLQRTPA